MANTHPAVNHTSTQKPSSDPHERLIRDAQETGDCLIATGADARRIEADLQEVRRLRLKARGGSVFKRPRSRFWQFKIPLPDGGYRYESSGTENRAQAERWLAFKVYQASEGVLPGTATFEQIIEHFLRDARARGLKDVARLERAAKALLKRLKGYRAEQIDYVRWLKYLDERSREVARDTVRFELSLARSAYKVALKAKLVRAVPEFPPVRNLHVRAGFVEPRDWARARGHLRAEFRDACDFALACGAREMETLALKWSDVEPDARVIHLRDTKTGQPRKIPYAGMAQLAGVIERRNAARRKRERAGVIAPWVFCFDTALKLRGRLYHAAGAPLFLTRARGDCALLPMFRSGLAAACARAGLPPLLFHDFRRSAARNLERAGVPRSVARMIGGWSDRIYSRYAIGAESELGSALGQAGDYLARAGWHFDGTANKNSMKSRGWVAEGGGSRTLRRTQCPPGRF